jgi:CheY-like chemotaxis protein
VSEPLVVLIVEDNEANQVLFGYVLEREGYQVDVAASSAEAIQRLTTRLPDLILMDLQLGGEDGLALTHRLKADPATEMIPIVALTALAMVEDRQRAMAAGCAGYISKPINTRIFPAQVLAYLPPLKV